MHNIYVHTCTYIHNTHRHLYTHVHPHINTHNIHVYIYIYICVCYICVMHLGTCCSTFLWDFSTLCVVDHFWPRRAYIHIYIYIYIYIPLNSHYLTLYWSSQHPVMQIELIKHPRHPWSETLTTCTFPLKEPLNESLRLKSTDVLMT